MNKTQTKSTQTKRIVNCTPAVLEGAHWPDISIDGLRRVVGRTAEAAVSSHRVAFALSLGILDSRLRNACSYLSEWHKAPPRTELPHELLDEYILCRAEAIAVNTRVLTVLAFDAKGCFWCLDDTPLDRMCTDFVSALRDESRDYQALLPADTDGGLPKEEQ